MGLPVVRLWRQFRGAGEISNVIGNINDLKSGQLRRLEKLSQRRVARELVVSPELAREMAAISSELARQVGVLIARSGEVEWVIVGDRKGILLPNFAKIRSAGERLKGVRCVHTHLKNEELSEDDLLDLLFLRLDLMAMLKVDGEGLPERLYVAHLVPTPVAGKNWLFLPPVVPSQQPPTCLELITALEREFAQLRPVKETDRGRDRALLISVTTSPKAVAEEAMAELVELARSDDIVVVETVIQRRAKVDARFIIGKGKLGELMLAALRGNANLLLFAQELNARQVNAITEQTELRVIDRTQLILDIFARRALSREGKLQIEMAQLKYMLPRLGLRDDALSRLTGGIGARGPGETKLEVDRRRIKDQLHTLEKRLEDVGRERSQRRARRRRHQLPVISLVGYTNAGKSTLLNSLTDSRIVAEDKLFATLDPTSRRLRFPEEMEVIVTDTVGFIRDLPDELLQAFKSTLEELAEADLLIHVIDVSNPRFPQQMAVVEKLLRELELERIPCLNVLNKIDLVESEILERWLREYDAVAVCARNSATFSDFLNRARKLVLKKWSPQR